MPTSPRRLRPILDVAQDLALTADEVSLQGRNMAKLTHLAVKRLLAEEPRGKLVLVSAITPTKYGEGKTTTSITLGQGLRARGVKTLVALREASMGPIFGAKGGGTGGGRASLEPSAQINLHCTGDLHAITAANNLLAALTDNAIHFRSPGAPDPRRVTWRRVMDMNERALRHIVTGLDGALSETAFDITAASEVMAAVCLASSLADLKARLGRLIVGYDGQDRPVTAQSLGATGPMAAILADAVLPNLVQTSDGTPAFVHGGPFANIAHGCSSVIGSRAALALADVVVTEAGFAFDLGGEKFFDIKCRQSGLWPSAVVLVVTARALRAHGGDAELTADADGAAGDGAVGAILRGMANVDRHVRAIRSFGFEPVVAINIFDRDTAAELDAIDAACRSRGLTVARHTGFAHGTEGGLALADALMTALAAPAPAPQFSYDLDADYETKITAIAKRVYGADGVTFAPAAQKEFKRAVALGLGNLPVCVAKTHLSPSDDPALGGDPPPFTLNVREARIRAGAGFLLALTGEILTMPALPKAPAALGIDVTDDGEITGVR
ncbi:MAG: formate--tetrahydrofolate ligase [Myxococcales bacterium]|nr:formate--tetrahydrofolate ligase [Myxococcales bacterium]